MRGEWRGLRWDFGRQPCWHFCLWVPWRERHRPLIYWW